MEATETRSVAIAAAQASLEPYIKSRHDAAQIRRILASFLESQLDRKAEHCAILSLPHLSTTNTTPSPAVRGLRKEYLKSVRANVKAQRDYDIASNQLESKRPSIGKTETRLDSYITLVKQRQKQERLRILQTYVDRLAEKSSLLEQQFDHVSGGLEAVPRLPDATLDAAQSGFAPSSERDLKSIIYELEKAVLIAKGDLKREKSALLQLKETSAHDSLNRDSSIATRVCALGKTRNELIRWVEVELGKTAESEGSGEAANGRSGDTDEALLRRGNVQAQYSRYVSTRQQFLDALSELEVQKLLPEAAETIKTEVSHQQVYPASQLLPFLRNFISVSNEQKSLILQRSHLTISLAKQYKETTQAFSRLADESHLLVAYSLPSLPSHKAHSTTATFADDMATKESPRLAGSARSWTYAASVATTNAKDTVLKYFDEGSAAIEDSRQTLLAIDSLLGRDEAGNSVDIWTRLDGNVGVLGRET